MADSTHADQALASGLVQPDQTTCGSCVLVVARMLADPSYAAFLVDGVGTGFGAGAGTLQDRFRAQALATHRLTSGFKDSSGGWKPPWPSALGTEPWALAREISHRAARRYGVHAVLPNRRGQDFGRLASCASAGEPVPVYVGNRWSPRHVVLALPSDEPPGDTVRIYDPASGRRYPIERRDFESASLSVAGWQVPWVLVLPG